MEKNVKRKYRFWIMVCICLNILAIVAAGYDYLKRNVPDEIFVVNEKDYQLKKLLNLPFLVSDPAVQVSTGNYYIQTYLFHKIPYKKIKIVHAEDSQLYVSGSAIGIYMKADGVLIIDTGEITSDTGEIREPAKNIVQPGDYIVAMNQEQITNKEDLVESLKELKNSTVLLSVKRDGELMPVSMDAVKDKKGCYKLGIWVRDDTQGIGTLTYVTPNGEFGALGHGISDLDTGEILSIQGGSLYRAQILGILKGKKGFPGELSGLIRYEKENIIGEISSNTKHGITGEFFLNYGEEISLKPMKIGYKQEIKTGNACIRCTLGNKTQEYKVKIIKVYMNHEDENKSFVIQVTDPELLEATGGIIQGMSGSPIIQDGKIIGAVTHVFVNDPTRGYGIFIEEMLEN